MASQRFYSAVREGVTSRSVDQVVLSRPTTEGQGAVVHRSIGGYGLRNFDPFLLLDEFNFDPQAGFPDHPHRGFETVNYMLEGAIEHEDCCGRRGTIGPGCLQWVTAGKGIVHAEMQSGEDNAHGLQLWVNLKARYKMMPPVYQELDEEEIPTVTRGGVTATVIAGEAFGVSSPTRTLTPIHYIRFGMDPDTQLRHPIPENMNAFLYMLSGSACVGEEPDEEEQIGPRNTVTLHQDGSGIAVETFDSGADFVLVCGEPTNEPVVQHGPFVMNYRQEILQAMLDYNNKSNGFENAARWFSEVGLPLTQANINNNNMHHHHHHHQQQHHPH